MIGSYILLCAAPQSGQNRAPTGTRPPHCTQFIRSARVLGVTVGGSVHVWWIAPNSCLVWIVFNNQCDPGDVCREYCFQCPEVFSPLGRMGLDVYKLYILHRDSRLPDHQQRESDRGIYHSAVKGICSGCRLKYGSGQLNIDRYHQYPPYSLFRHSVQSIQSTRGWFDTDRFFSMT